MNKPERNIAAENAGHDKDELASRLAIFNQIELHSSDVFWIMNLQMETVYMSPSVKRTLGYSVDEYMSMPLFERLPPESYALSQKVMMEEILPVVKGIKPDTGEPVVFEMLHKHKSGHLIWGELSINFMRNNEEKVAFILGITRDINDRKMAQIALAQAKEQYRLLVERTIDWVWELDADSKLTYLNPAGLSKLGLSADEVIGKSPFDFSDSDQAVKDRAWFENLTNARQPFTGYIQVLRDKNSRLCYLEHSATPVFDENGQMTGYRGIARDVTDLQPVMKKYERNEHSREFILRFDGIAYIELDDQLEITEWNAGAVKLFGYSKQEAVLLKIFPDLWKPADRKKNIDDLHNSEAGDLTMHTAVNRRRDTTDIRCRWYRYDRFSLDGKILGTLFIVQDASQGNEAVLTTAESSRLLSSLGFLHCYINRRQFITHMSEGLAALLGHPVKAMTGKHIRTVIGHEKATELRTKGILLARRTLNWKMPVRIENPAGVGGWYRMQVSPLSQDYKSQSLFAVLFAPSEPPPE